jgi:hypothetical protein
MFWTGNNWIVGNTYIEPGYTIRMKPSSPNTATRILTGKTVYVKPGATLAYESGADVQFEPGASISTTGGTLRIENNATLRINNGGQLIAEPSPGTIELGNNATLIIEDDGNLVWNANTNWVFGVNAKVEIYGTVKVSDAVTLNFPHNSQVYAYEGARFEMGAGSSIATEGIFQAVGTEQQPIEFVNRPSGVEGNWQGISAKSHQLIETGDLELEHVSLFDATKPIHIEIPAKGTLNSVSITNPTIGIEVVWDPYGSPPTETTSIINTTIENAQAGIVIVDCPAEVLIQGCTITGNGGGGGEAISAGILLSNSSPRILSSSISGFEWGIRGVAGSSPVLQQEDMHGGFNVITANNVGVYFEEGSHAILGYAEGEGGQNSIFENFSKAVVLEIDCVVEAYLNWWGMAPPDPEIFSIGDGCELYYDPWLEEPPGGFPPGLAGGTGNATLGPDPRMNLAITNRVMGNYAAALLVFKEIIDDADEPWKNKAWALDQITSLGRVTFNTGISTYLRSLVPANPTIRRKIASVLPAAFLHERLPEDAIAAYEAVISNYPNSSSERQALYGKFVHGVLLAASGPPDRRWAPGGRTGRRFRAGEEVTASQVTPPFFGRG